MTKHEQIAARNIRAAFNFEFGGLYNAYLDGETNFPTMQEMKDYIYTYAMKDYYGPGLCQVDLAPREMRFAGEKFCRDYIDKIFAEDAEVAEIPWKK